MCRIKKKHAATSCYTVFLYVWYIYTCCGLENPNTQLLCAEYSFILKVNDIPKAKKKKKRQPLRCSLEKREERIFIQEANPDAPRDDHFSSERGCLSLSIIITTEKVQKSPFTARAPLWLEGKKNERVCVCNNGLAFPSLYYTLIVLTAFERSLCLEVHSLGMHYHKSIIKRTLAFMCLLRCFLCVRRMKRNFQSMTYYYAVAVVTKFTFGEG